jgi:hypothetical protein
MKIELRDVDEIELICFMESLAEVDDLSEHQMGMINDAICHHFDTVIQIARHHDGEDWQVWK